MSAETLRKAASKMRARAAAARAGVWEADNAAVTARWTFGPHPVAMCSGSLSEGNAVNAAHIASWHPAVALAVAAWLDIEAAKWQQLYDDTQAPSRGIDQPPAVNYGNPTAARENADHHCRSALTVARAYLGDRNA